MGLRLRTKSIYLLPQILVIVIIVLSVFITSNLTSNREKNQPDKIKAAKLIYTYNVYPNFWKIGNYDYTAKRYFLVYGSKNPGYNLKWVWSGPYPSYSYCIKYPNNCTRFVRYQNYIKKVPDDLLGIPLTNPTDTEWEEWKPSNLSAILYRYGAPDENATKISYSKKEDCMNNTNRGNLWPNATSAGTVFFKESFKHPENYCTKEYNESDPRGGGYIAVNFQEDWGTPSSDYRNSKCNAWFPTTGNYDTIENKRVNAICKASPNVAIIQNRYATGYHSTNDLNYYGCEMVIYAWGYPYSSSNQYRDWFRNGPLRYTDYKKIGPFGKIEPTADSWWNSNCTNSSAPYGNAWDAVPNWYYSGIYRFNTENPIIDNIPI